MGRLLEMLPIINIFKWADGDEYTVEENTIDLPPELAKSDEETDEKWEKHHVTPAKSKSKFKVEKDQLNTEKAETQGQQEKAIGESSKGMEIGE